MSHDRMNTIDGLVQFGRYDDESGSASYRAFTGGRVNHGLIAGDTGSGKSHVLKTITHSLLRQLAATLVYLDGQDGASSPALWEMAAVRSGRHGADKVIDGLDEQVADRHRQQGDNLVGFEPNDDTPIVLVVLDEMPRLLDPHIAERLAKLGRYGTTCGLMLLATSQLLGLRDAFAGSTNLRTVLLHSNRIVMRTSDTVSRDVIARHGFADLDVHKLQGVRGFNAPADTWTAHSSPFTWISE